MKSRGFFITFEGGEGCGKSFQSRAIFRHLEKLGFPVLLTHEPGGSTIGDRITRILKWDKASEISPLTELLLFNASRAQLVDGVIRPALAEGKIVLSDRFADSTLAYQGYGRRLDLKLVQKVNNAVTQELQPQLTILLDIPVEQGLARKHGQNADRFHQTNLAFHRRVRRGFLYLAKADPKRWLVIDASQTKQQITKIIRERIARLLSR